MKKAAVVSGIALFLSTIIFIQHAIANGRADFSNFNPTPVAFAPDRVLVKFTDSVTDVEADQIVRNMGKALKRKMFHNAFRMISVQRGRIWQTIRALKKNPRVIYAHPDWRAYAHFVPDDPMYSLQWNFHSPDQAAGSIKVENAWMLNSGGDSGILVAVLDTGIAYENYDRFCLAPDFEFTAFAAGYDFINNDSHPNDDNGHGTHVAGTIAQSTNNGRGVAGIAFNTSLMPVKVLDYRGGGYISQIASGIRFAADNGAHIINMSLGTSAPRWALGALEDAVRYAHGKGVLIIASSGNGSANQPGYPAGYAEVIAVGATKYDKTLADYSNRGNEVCAPGGTQYDWEDRNADGEPDMIIQQTFDIQTKAECDFDYWFLAGTSMAAPHVSGVAALMMAANPTITRDEVRLIIRDTADGGAPAACGSGIIDAGAAVAAVSIEDMPPDVSIVSPMDGSVVAESVSIEVRAADREDPAGTLEVEWSVDGQDVWQQALYYSNENLYRAVWDTQSYIDGTIHTLMARATDNYGNTTNSSPIMVTINNANEPPIASFSYSCSGRICEFDASGSYDTDGSIIDYAWDFGDGTPAGGVTVSHEFGSSGEYNVSLTVTDNEDSTGTDSQTVTISEHVSSLHIADLDASKRNLFWGMWQATIYFTVQNSERQPVSGAVVSGVFDDSANVYQCTTNSSGICSVSGYQFQRNCLTFSVTQVNHDSLVYQSDLNEDPDGDSDGTHILVCP